MTLKVTVDPNPFSSELLVLIEAAFTVNVVIRLITEGGKTIKITSGTLRTGNNEIKLDKLERYAPGHYQLEIKLLNGDLLENIALVKDQIVTAL